MQAQFQSLIANTGLDAFVRKQVLVHLPPALQAHVATGEAELAVHSKQILQWANPGCAAPVTSKYPLMYLPHAVGLVVVYLSFIFIAGFLMRYVTPKFVCNIYDKIFKLVSLPYNIVQVVLCAWMCYAAGAEAINQHYKVICNPFDDKKAGMAFIVWVFYVSKALDFLDTVFIVMRSKWQQLTFLHVYHHVSIFLIYWMNAHVGFDGDIYITVVLNSFIHFVMYLYYLLCAIGMPPPWKRVVTQLQLVQFIAMISQAVYSLYFSCAFPKNIVTLYGIYIFSLFLLFLQFYIRSYIAGGSKRGGSRSSSSASNKTPAKTPAKGAATTAAASSSSKKSSKRD